MDIYSTANSCERCLHNWKLLVLQGMKDVFETIDNYGARFNVFRDHIYLQKVSLIFSLLMLIPWLALGFDSGIGMLEIWNNGWQLDYSAYGKSLHFSAFVIYGLLFYGLSKHLQKLGLKRSKNVFYSASLAVFNIGVFELWYMGSFATFQMNRSLTEWFFLDFWAPPVVMNFMFVALGAVALLSFYVDGFKLNDKKVVGRLYKLQDSRYTLLLIACLLFSIFLWVTYPFPVQAISINGWQNSRLFPQTHYAYVNTKLYVQNDLLHLVNLTVKAMFAITQFYILTRFKKV